MLDGCVLSMGAGALACAIAEQLDDEELAVMAAFVTVLGDALALIAVQRSKGGGFQLHAVACGAFFKGRNPRERYRSGILCDKPKPRYAD